MNAAEIELFKDVLTGAVYDESAWRCVRFDPPDPQARWRGTVKRWLLRRLAQRLERGGLTMMRRIPFDAELRGRGEDWPFVGYTMIGRRRLDHLQHCVEQVIAEGVPGDFIETGVWRGGACMLVKKLLDAHGVRDRTVWLADSFQGMPAPKNAADGMDLQPVEFLAVSAEQVRRNFARFGLLDERVRLVEGWFADTLPRLACERLAVLRLDGDMYHSTMDALTSLYPRVAPGGFVVVDDYGSWPSCRRAVHDYLATRGEQPVIEKIDATGVWWRKS